MVFLLHSMPQNQSLETIYLVLCIQNFPDQRSDLKFFKFRVMVAYDHIVGIEHQITVFLCATVETRDPCACHPQGPLEHGCQPHAHQVGIVPSLLPVSI